jgi:hypothetical protein
MARQVENPKTVVGYTLDRDPLVTGSMQPVALFITNGPEWFTSTRGIRVHSQVLWRRTSIDIVDRRTRLGVDLTDPEGATFTTQARGR